MRAILLKYVEAVWHEVYQYTPRIEEATAQTSVQKTLTLFPFRISCSRMKLGTCVDFPLHEDHQLNDHDSTSRKV